MILYRSMIMSRSHATSIWRIACFRLELFFTTFPSWQNFIPWVVKLLQLSIHKWSFSSANYEHEIDHLIGAHLLGIKGMAFRELIGGMPRKRPLANRETAIYIVARWWPWSLGFILLYCMKGAVRRGVYNQNLVQPFESRHDSQSCTESKMLKPPSRTEKKFVLFCNSSSCVWNEDEWIQDMILFLMHQAQFSHKLRVDSWSNLCTLFWSWQEIGHIAP